MNLVNYVLFQEQMSEDQAHSKILNQLLYTTLNSWSQNNDNLKDITLRHRALWHLDRSMYERFVKVIDGEAMSIFWQLEWHGYVQINDFGLGKLFDLLKSE